jgi:class 3 adenylate cyclase
MTRQRGGVARFEEIAQESVGRRRGRIVKSLGDGILTLFETPMDASQAGVDLMRRLAAEGLPTAHIGLTVGPVVRRDGDVFGNSVNLAARLAGFANPSETVTPRSSVPDGEVAGHQWIDGGEVTPKDFAPIHIMRLRPLADSADDNQHPANPD